MSKIKTQFSTFGSSDVMDNILTKLGENTHNANFSSEVTKNALRPLITTFGALPYEAWIEVDEAVEQVVRDMPGPVSRLKAMGFNTPVDVGTGLSVYQPIDDTEEPDVSYELEANVEKNRQDIQPVFTPVPAIHSEWDVKFRSGQAAMAHNVNLAAEYAAGVAENIVIKLNELLANGGFALGGNDMYGMTTHPNRMTQSITVANWTNPDTDTKKKAVLSDFAAAHQKMVDRNLDSDMELAVSREFMTSLQTDYSEQKGDRTLVERIEAYSGMGPGSVTPFYQLPANTAILFTKKKKFFDFAVGAEIQSAVYMENPYKTEYCTFTIQGPRVKKVFNAGKDAASAEFTTGHVHLRA